MKQHDRQVVLIVGAPRSGTSLLYKLLCTHPDVNYLSNWNRRFPRIPQLARLRQVPVRRVARRDQVWFPGANAYVAGERPWRDRLFPMPVEADAFYAACGLYEAAGDEARRATVGELVSRRLGAAMRSGGGTHLVLKCVANNAHLDALTAAFPEARIVDITRDGRDVASSLATVDWWQDVDLWWWRGTPREWAAAGNDPMEACARHWVAEVERLQHTLRAIARPHFVHSLRYEDLVRDPATALHSVSTHIGLRSEPAWLAQAAALPTGRKRGDAPVVPPIVDEVQADLLTALGYQPHEFSS